VKYLPVKPEDYMRLSIVETLSGAPYECELVVVVDVFRAWASAYAALEAGAKEILLARDAEQALALRLDHPDWILVGERDGRMPVEFDFPNSPTIILQQNLTGRTVVLATDAGTPAVHAVENAKRVLLGSFIGASAVVDVLEKSSASEVLLLAPGDQGEIRSLEDTMCAMFLKNAVEGYPNSYEALRNYLRNLPSASMFFDSARTDAPEQDFDFCTDLDRFDFALDAVPDGQGVFRVERRCDAANAPQGGAA
jgi:2-phosphosulfolactate phosphatase